MKIRTSMATRVIALGLVVTASCSDDGGVNGVAMPQAASIAGAPAEIALTVGETEDLAITVFDSDGDPIQDPVLTFTSSDGAVATVDPEGVVTAVAEGRAVVTVETAGLTAQVGVTVQAVVVGSGPSSLRINPPGFGMEVGETVQLSVTVLDQEGREIPNAVVTFSSDNEDVATVDTNGLVKAIKPSLGTWIIATSGAVSDTASAFVRALSNHEHVVIEPAKATISVGERLQLTATVLNENGNEVTDPQFSVRWDPHCEDVEIGPQTFTTYCYQDVATVNHNGIVTGVGKGNLTIYAGWEPGGFGIDITTAGWAVITVE